MWIIMMKVFWKFHNSIVSIIKFRSNQIAEKIESYFGEILAESSSSVSVKLTISWITTTRAARRAKKSTNYVNHHAAKFLTDSFPTGWQFLKWCLVHSLDFAQL